MTRQEQASKAASILGQRGRGKAKTLTDEQREQRRAQMAVARETRWSKRKEGERTA